MNQRRLSLSRNWSNARISSAESQTSISLIHIEVIATRGTPMSYSRQSVFSLFDHLCSKVWSKKQHLHHLQSCNLWWGWHPANVKPIIASNKDFVQQEKMVEPDAESEADLSGWDTCGFVYGSGVYDSEEEEEGEE